MCAVDGEAGCDSVATFGRAVPRRNDRLHGEREVAGTVDVDSVGVCAERRLFRPRDCSDLIANRGAWQGIRRDEVGTIRCRPQMLPRPTTRDRGAAVSQRAIVDVPAFAGALARERIATAHIDVHREMNHQEQTTARAAPPDSTTAR